MSMLVGVSGILETPAFRFLVGIAALYLGYRGVGWGVDGVQRTLVVWRNEPIPIADADRANGTIEVEGTAEKLTESVSGKYSGRSCFAYRYETKRKKRTKNDDGEWETDTTTVESGSNSVPFRVTDETGSIPVDPSAATIGMDTEYRSSSGSRRSATGETIRTERRIDPGDELHIIGQKRSAGEADADMGDATTFIGDGDAAPTFRITEGSELETVVRMFGRSVAAICLGVVSFGLALYLVGTAVEAQFDLGTIAVAIAADVSRWRTSLERSDRVRLLHGTH